MLGAVVAALKALGAILGLVSSAKSEKAGADAMAIKVDENTIAAQERIQDAQNNGTHDAAGTIDKLQQHKF